MLTNPNITKNAQAAQSSWEGGPLDSPETSNPVSESFPARPSAVIQWVLPPLCEGRRQTPGENGGAVRRCALGSGTQWDPAGGILPRHSGPGELGALRLRAAQVQSLVES